MTPSLVEAARETLSPQCDLSAANIITNSKPIIERGENVRRAKSGCNRLDSRTEQAKQPEQYRGAASCFKSLLSF